MLVTVREVFTLATSMIIIEVIVCSGVSKPHQRATMLETPFSVINNNTHDDLIINIGALNKVAGECPEQAPKKL